MNYTLRHTTRYVYSEPVTLCHNEARLLPRDTPTQRCEPSQVSVQPRPTAYAERRDLFGNRVLYFSLEDVHREFEVTVCTRLETMASTSLPMHSLSWEVCRDALRHDLDDTLLQAQPFLLDSPFVRTHSELTAFSAPCFTPGRPLLEAVIALNDLIHDSFDYDPSVTTIATPLADVLTNRHGVCQDFAHLAIGCLRSHGLAARYVSGYLETRPPPGQPRLIGADASHAWFSVLLPGWGWLDLDPTNGSLPGEQHPVLGWGRDYADVAPLKGVMNGGGEHMLEVEVDVIPERG